MRAAAQPVPPKIRPVSSPGWFAGVVLAATAVAAGAVLYFFNPSTHGFYPVCRFHQLTGWNCPGCGATRALYALLHGELRLAVKDNALLVLSLPLLAVWSVRLGWQQLRHQPVAWPASPWFWFGFLVVATFFGVLRNLPGFSWLAP